MRLTRGHQLTKSEVCVVCDCLVCAVVFRRVILAWRRSPERPGPTRWQRVCRSTTTQPAEAEAEVVVVVVVVERHHARLLRSRERAVTARKVDSHWRRNCRANWALAKVAYVHPVKCKNGNGEKSNWKGVNGKKRNGRLGYRKIGQPEYSATKNMRVGKKGNKN